MNGARVLVAALCLCAITVSANDEGALIRYELENDKLTLGGSVLLRITVLVPTWFSKAPQWPHWEIPNCATRLPPDSSYSSVATIDGVSYAGLVREYYFTPQIAGRFELEAKSVGVTWMDSDEALHRYSELSLPKIIFEATRPSAATDLQPYIAASELTLSESIDGVDEPLLPGNAISRSIIIEAAQTPAMFLPELNVDAAGEGLAVYPEEARVAETADFKAGSFISSRTQTTNYVFESPGEFVLPEVTLRWYDLDSDEIKTSTLPARVIRVQAAAGESSPQAGVIKWMLPGFGIVLALWLGRVFQQRRLRKDPELQAWQKLKSACASKDLRRVHRALEHWLLQLCAQNETIVRDRIHLGDAHLTLEACLFASPAKRPRIHAAELSRSLYRQARSIRRRYRRPHDSGVTTTLPVLNP